MGLSWTFVFLVSVIGFIIIPRTFVLLNFSLIHKFKEQIYAIIKEKSPLAALLLIPVTIISGAYWTSIPFYLVIATLWLFQRKSSIPWEAGISLMGSCLLAIFIVSKTDYAYWIYTIKIIGCFVIVVSLRPAIQNQHRFWIGETLSCAITHWENSDDWFQNRLPTQSYGCSENKNRSRHAPWTHGKSVWKKRTKHLV